MDKTTHIDQDKLKNHLVAKWGPTGCPMCQQGSWEIGPRVFELREFYRGGLRTGGPILIVAPVTCSNCGYTVLVNAMQAALLSENTKEKVNE